MNYILRGEGRPDIKICRAETLPRIGDTIELDGATLTVIGVMHEAYSPMQSPPTEALMQYAISEMPTVRVR